MQSTSFSKILVQQARWLRARTFATSSSRCGNRAIVYSCNGNPSSVLSVVTLPDLPPPPPNTVNVRFLLSPINPADLNVIEGVYPTKPSFYPMSDSAKPSLYVAGNEGLAEVIQVGSNVMELQPSDRVIMTKPQIGTWMSGRNVDIRDVLKVPSDLPDAQLATVAVNPATAYNILHGFVQLQRGDWVVQNGANSAVGQAVIQISAANGWKTLNFIRDRENVELLKSYLMDLGATHVATYNELSDKAFLKTLTGNKNITLGLNCISGETTTAMARLLGRDAHLVSYGAMSKAPLSLPTSLFIFKNLTCHGFWQGRWYSDKSLEERKQLMETLFHLMRDGKLRDPAHEILVFKGTETDQQVREKISIVIRKLAGGKYDKKVLLKVEETP